MEQIPEKAYSHQTLQTRGRIVTAALRLFNERGFGKVTTHDVAHEAGISPGNLYYHFKNKDEILKEIFARMEIFSEQSWYLRGPKNPKGSFLDFMQFFFGNLERYRFFFREFPFIVQTVPAMDKLWVAKWEHLQTAMRQAVGLWSAAGILKAFATEADVDAFLDAVWILANFGSVHYELVAGNRRYAKKREVELIVRYLYPYHTPKGQRALDLYLAE